jgi:hypothetical protein
MGRCGHHSGKAQLCAAIAGASWWVASPVQAAVTQHHELVTHKQQTSIPQSWRLEVQCQVMALSVCLIEVPSWSLDGAFSLHPHMMEGAEGPCALIPS